MRTLFVALVFCCFSKTIIGQIYRIEIRESQIFLITSENRKLDSIKLSYTNDFGFISDNSLYVIHSNVSNSNKPNRSYEFTKYTYKRGAFKKKILSRFIIISKEFMCEDKKTGFTINNFRIYQKDNGFIWEYGYAEGQKHFSSTINRVRFKKISREICKDLKKIEMYEECFICKIRW